MKSWRGLVPYGCMLTSFAALALPVETRAGSLRNVRLELFTMQGGEITPVRSGATIGYRVPGGRACYGWRATFDPTDTRVSFDELLLLPKPARSWGGTNSSDVADDRSSAETEIEIDGRNGVAMKSWCAVKGDPMGLYRFIVFHEGRKLGLLSFRLKR